MVNDVIAKQMVRFTYTLHMTMYSNILSHVQNIVSECYMKSSLIFRL